MQRDSIIKHVNQIGDAGKINYLPHRPVIRSDKKRTKVRIVDGSAKSNGPSLNDCIYIYIYRAMFTELQFWYCSAFSNVLYRYYFGCKASIFEYWYL